MSTATLVKALTTPNKIASALDWRKVKGSTILSLSIQKDKIGVAIASHPSFQEAVTVLEPLKLERSKVSGSKKISMSLEETQRSILSNIVSDYKVCGVVVAWPLQHDTGRMGAACGQVLNTLEELVSSRQGKHASGQESPVLNNRPICLWDKQHTQPNMDHVDSWGRSVSFSHRRGEVESSDVLPPTVREQFSEDEAIVAAQVWDDFFFFFWPSAYEEKPVQKRRPLSLVEDYEYNGVLEEKRSDSTMRQMQAAQ